MINNAIVIHPMVQCMINRNLCQKIKNYFEINNIKICSTIFEADIIVFSGCGVLESNEIEGLHIIQFIKKYIENSKKNIRFVLVGCLPKINEKTKGTHKNSFNEYEELIIENDFKKDSKAQFVIVDNYDYTILDELIQANILFKNIPYPTKISATNGLDQMKLSININKGTKDVEIKQQQKNYLELISTQAKIVKKGFLYPASNDYLMVYGYQQIIIGSGCKNNCAYCAVKFAKDKIKSISPDIIIQQMKELVLKGENKFVLIADDIGSWGIDLNLNWTDLIKMIDELVCDEIKIAIFNIKAEDILDYKYIIDPLVNKQKISYLCVMSQHINKRVLLSMGRKPFNKQYFLEMINEYGDKGVQIETFTIIGFPGETKEEFQELVEFIQNVRTVHFANYSTPFSARYGTAAYHFADQIPKEIIMQRVQYIDNKYIESSIKRFSSLPQDLKDNLIKLISLLKEHEINYELASSKKILQLENNT